MRWYITFYPISTTEALQYNLLINKVIMQIGWSNRYTDKCHLYVYTRYSDKRLC